METQEPAIPGGDEPIKNGGRKQPTNNRGRAGKELSNRRVSTLEAMRHVVTSGIREDRTYQHKEMRRVMELDRQKFLAQLLRLEGEERERKEKERGRKVEAGEEKATERDETVKELEVLIDKLLGELGST